MRLAHAARALRDRRTDRPASSYERNLACTRCDVLVAVFEACTGAASDAGHEWIDPARFVCARCLEAIPQAEGEAKADYDGDGPVPYNAFPGGF